MQSIDVGVDFHPRLANRDKKQGDGKYNAIDFRNKYLQPLDAKEQWKIQEPYIGFDFKNVNKIGPSFANEAFAYFAKYASPELILKRIQLINTTEVQLRIIKAELNAGYNRE